ncbi:hypothetical protein C8Q76DRAFT_698492 [Earliella scabrosa]|nr:hypothetical protein C8Q76DRAFT_698492 [Earliella scabrosa]
MRNVVLFSASGAMFVVAVIHISVDIHIIVTEGIMSGANLQTLAYIIGTLNGAKHFARLKLSIYIVQSLIADGFMTYRAFVVWDRSWAIIALPLSVLVIGALLGVTTVVLQHLMVDPSIPPVSTSDESGCATRCRTGCEGESASCVRGDYELTGPSYGIQREVATLYTARERG